MRDLTDYERRVRHWASRVLRVCFPHGYHTETDWPPALADVLRDPTPENAERLELVIAGMLHSPRPCSLSLYRLDRAPAPPATHDAGPGDTTTEETGHEHLGRKVAHRQRQGAY